MESLRPALMALQSKGELVDIALLEKQPIDARADQRILGASRKFLKAFQDPAGLVGRPWYKNMWVATDPLNSYAASIFPMVREALQVHDQIRLAEAVNRTAFSIQKATSSVELMLVAFQANELPR